MVTTTATTVLADPQTEAESQLERARVKLQEHKSKGSNDRIIGQWQTRVNEAQAAVDKEHDLAIQGKSDNSSGDDDMAETKGNSATKARTKTIKTGGSTHCLCGCGTANNPGSKFQMGHDARLKSIIGKVAGGIEGFSVPQIAIDAATAGTFKVGDYDSAKLLKIVTGSTNGSKPKATKKAKAKTTTKAKAGAGAK